MSDTTLIRIRKNTDKNIERLQRKTMRTENRTVSKGEIVDKAILKELEEK